MRAIERIQQHWRTCALILSATFGILVGISNAGTTVERMLSALAWSLRKHPASGSLHIVEIDARSIAAIDRWPWPRGNHAVLVDRLRSAGATSIAFDVDFSANSNPADDQAFAESVARAGGKVTLPTFGQAAGGGQEGWTDSLAIPVLRANATLASVSILPDGDGNVRRAPVGTVTEGLPRPSLSAAIAGINGSAGEDFPIDFSIDPTTIPRHSFIDVRDGRLPPGSLVGRNVLIGATAIEMGDRYAIPQYGVTPGVVIQALAAETLRHGKPVELGWQLPLFFALLLAGVILQMRSRRSLAVMIGLAPIVLFGVSVVISVALHWVTPLAPAFATLACASLVALAMRALVAMRRRRAHDAETGLPNRYALRDALRTYSGAGVVTARIADFEKMTAGIGASGTAELVRRVADRIGLIAEGSTIYRVEDRVLAWRSYDQEELDGRVRALRAAMLNPVEVAGRRVDATLGVGYAVEKDDGDSDRVIANAVLAAEVALSSGSGWHAHDLGDDETLDRELSLLGELDEAIGKGEIRVVYQPKLELRSGRITSVETLVRWHHSTRGFLRPDLFIPLAERNDRIAGMTLHVIAQTIDDLLEWHLKGYPITGAVNLSAKLLSSAPFIEELRALIERTGIDPKFLTFEVTESAAMSDPTVAAAALRSFSDLGIAISMDDYGTGQSSLSYIKQLPLNELKIDRSFVQFAHQNRGDGVLVRSTVDLAHELGLKVVAEGVEDVECLDFLRSIGCDMAQGYLISRPVPAEELQQLLVASQAQAA